MEFARITEQWAAEYVAVLLDEDVSAVQEVADVEREQAEIDRLIESVDHELAAEDRRAAFRLARDAGDGQWVRRSRRRSERAAVRRLPSRLPVEDVAVEFGEAA